MNRVCFTDFAHNYHNKSCYASKQIDHELRQPSRIYWPDKIFIEDLWDLCFETPINNASGLGSGTP